MIFALFKKEINDFLKSKTSILFIILFSSIISYSFYSAVDLYSKASIAAIDNPLYAAGFEPVSGIFVPAFGGFFIIMSLIAPFLFIQPISFEKNHNTITLIAQFPMSLKTVFVVKFISATVFLLIIMVFLLPIFIIWYLIGGHLPFAEIILLFLGYFLYGLLIISISFFSSSVFNNNAQSSMTALSLIIFSWFLDFGKDMNILPFINNISKWSVTKQLKYFDNGILSFQAINYFVLLIILFCVLSYIFFDFSIKSKSKPVLITFVSFLVLFFINTKINYNYDLTESRKNSFSIEKTEFLKKIPSLSIKIYLEQTDSRAKDYENDFLKKLKLVKSDVKVKYVTGKELKNNYGIYKYEINGKADTTFSNSEEEIFMILENLSGLKLKKENEDNYFKGYPLVVNKGWSFYMFIFYLILLPFGILIIYFKKQIIHTRRIL